MKNFLMTTIAIFGLATISFGQTIPSYIPSVGLVGWWPFNGNANDESGNGNDGTVNGAALSTDRNGILDNAYYFSSADCETRIDVALNVNQITTGLTLSYWALQSGNGCIAPRIMEFYSIGDGPGTLNTQNWNEYWQLFHVLSNNTYINLSGNPTPLDTWFQLTYTNDGSFAKLYQNGNLVDSALVSGNPILSPNFSIGRMNHPAYDAHQGNIDDIGIWNRALNQEEITSLYSGSSAGISDVSQSNLFSVFPNPAQSVINVNIDDKLVGSVFTIYDNIGKAVKTGKLNSSNTTIELNDLTGGIYTFNVGGNSSQTFKIIKE